MSWSVSLDMPLRKCVTPVSVCVLYFKSLCGIRMWPMESIPRPPISFGV